MIAEGMCDSRLTRRPIKIVKQSSYFLESSSLSYEHIYIWLLTKNGDSENVLFPLESLNLDRQLNVFDENYLFFFYELNRTYYILCNLVKFKILIGILIQPLHVYFGSKKVIKLNH